jgi:gamma-glutamylcyclotransferase
MCGMICGMAVEYFAYGSNMDEQELREGCKSCRALGPARLDDHRLAFTRRSIRTHTGVADVVYSPREMVWGVLYLIDEGDLDTVDKKEGAGWAYIRTRKRVRLARDGSTHDAITYTVLNKEPVEVPPSRTYLDRLMTAAREHGLPNDYIEAVGARPTAEAPIAPTDRHQASGSTRARAR